MENYLSDRSENRVFNLWLDEMGEMKGAMFHIDHPMVQDLLDIGVQEFIDWALEEVPLLGTQGSYYDMESLWKEFIYTHRKGTKIETNILEMLAESIDYTCYLEEIDDNMISECYNPRKIEMWLDNFKLTPKQKDYIIEIFEERGSEMENTGYHNASEEIRDIGRKSDMHKEYKNNKYFLVDIPLGLKEEITLVFTEDSIKNFLGGIE